jgi:hypothetical protein
VEDTAYARIRQLVWQALYRWEQAGAAGSARPVFERAWTNGLELERIAPTQQLAIARDKLYQHWLREGVPLTPTLRSAILDSRPAARRILDGLQVGIEREPGEDG